MTPAEAHAETLRRIYHARDTGDDLLDLGDLPIEAVPEEIGLLKDQLRVLALGKRKPVREAGQLNWKHTDGRPAKVADVSSLAGLAALTTLDLSSCGGVTDIGPLAGLAALTTLDLSYASVTDVGSLAGLTTLTTLKLAHCYRATDVGPLAGLAALATLNLSWCVRLVDVGPLAGLAALTTLDLSWCVRLVDVGPLAGLAALTTLDLSWREGLVDVGPLAKLTTLTTLDLSNCEGVTDVGPLAGLAALTTLNLSSTGVTDVGPLAGLAALTTLKLASCRDLSFVPIRWLLPTLGKLVLYQADFTDLPAAVCGEKYDENVLGAVRAYYDDLGRDPEGDAELKVFLLGNGRVGKTKLARRLTGLDYGADQEPSTHGVRLGTFPLTIPGLSHPVRLNLWDFGGQDIYLGSHALFLQGQAVFLLLWTPDHEQGREYQEGGFTIRDRPLAYWLDYLRGLAGTDRNGHRVVESPVVLIRSQCDVEADECDPPVPLDKVSFPRLYPLAYGAKQDYGRDFLDAYLRKAVKALLTRRKQPLIGKGRAKVRAKIREWQAKPEDTRKRTITRVEFDHLCEKTGGISNTGEFLKFLHRSGVVFYRDGVFGDRVILDQTWALDAVYTVFHRRTDLQDAIGAARGRFTREKLDKYVWGPDRRAKKLPPYAVEDQRTFLALMEQCGICFRVGQRDHEPVYIAPELLPAWDQDYEAEFGELIRNPDAVVTLRYPFLHDGVIRGFLSKLGDKAREHARYWKFGCWFYDQGTDSRVLIRAGQSTDPTSGAGAIALHARGPGAKDLLRTLVRVATQLPLGQPLRLAPPDAFDRPDPPAAVPTVSPVDLLRPAFPRRTLFVSYRHGESREYLNELIPVLEAATGEPARVVWDRHLQNDNLISGFIDSVRTIPVLVVLLGPSYLQSRYCLSELFGVFESSGCDLERFRMRVLPLIFDAKDARDPKIDDADTRGDHAAHWTAWSDRLAQQAGKLNLGTRDYELARQMSDWGRWLGDALEALADPLLPRGWAAIRADGFRAVRDILEERFRRLGVS